MKREKYQVLRWLLSVLGSDRWKICWMTAIQALLGGSAVLSAWFLRGIIDGAVSGDSFIFRRYSAALLILLAAQLAQRALDRYLTESTRSSLENRFKGRLFSILLKKDYAAVTAAHSGEWMNRLTSDTAEAAEGLATILPKVSGMVVRLAGALALMLRLMPQLVCVILPGGLLLVLLTYAFRRVLKRLHREIREADGRLRVFLTEQLHGMLVIRAFGMEEQAEQGAQKKMEEHRRARMRRNHFSNLCNVGFGFALSGAYAIGAVYCGYEILIGTVSYGTFTAVLQLIGQIRSPFANITGYVPRYYAMLASAERLMEAETFAEDCAEPQLTAEEIRTVYKTEFIGIGFFDACFAYHDRNEEEAFEVLSGFRFNIRRGECVAFTGQSGCGKSTVLKLLMCMYPLDAGDRYLETTGEFLTLTAKYRGLFAYVPQGNQLLSGTIREIIAFGDDRAMQDEEGLHKALEISCADEFVDKLEAGLDTPLGEHGTGLSEGQMQRIAIARAIFSEHPILLLDEATSSLDEDTEERLLANLRAMTDRTILIVTHRPAALKICDRVVNFDNTGESDRKKGDVRS